MMLENMLVIRMVLLTACDDDVVLGFFFLNFFYLLNLNIFY